MPVPRQTEQVASGRLPGSESLRLEDFNGLETRRIFHNPVRTCGKIRVCHAERSEASLQFLASI